MIDGHGLTLNGNNPDKILEMVFTFSLFFKSRVHSHFNQDAFNLHSNQDAFSLH